MCTSSSSRREFLTTAVSGAAALALAGQVVADLPVASDGRIPTRPFGRAKEQVSLLCIGGFHIGMCAEEEGIRIVQEAVDNGATFMDNSWCYHDGRSEERMGKALKGGRRDKAFVMTKCCARDKKTALQYLEDSLRRLQTDHLDLWQFHEIVYDDDADMIFAADGAIEAADQAKKQGKVRYIGLTGHKQPAQLLKMLAFEYPWDSVQMPLNPFDGTFQSFQHWVLPVLKKRGIAAMAMKTRGSGNLVRSGAVTAEECWRYVIALPIATVVSGMESLDLLRKNFKMARELKPMTSEEMDALHKRTAELAAGGKHEPYKVSRAFDSPVGRKIHGVPLG